MTSTPASRSARETTFTPRSWPSSPTLQVSTRQTLCPGLGRAGAVSCLGRCEPAGWLTAGCRSEEGGFAVDTEDFLQGRHHLAFRGVGLHALEQPGHQVFATAGRCLQIFQPVAHAGPVAPAPQRVELGALRLLNLTPDAQDGWPRIVALGEGVDPDDDALIGFQLALELESRVGDLALEEPLIDAGQHASLFGDPVEVAARAALDLVGQRFEEVGPAQGIDR